MRQAAGVVHSREGLFGSVQVALKLTTAWHGAASNKSGQTRIFQQPELFVRIHTTYFLISTYFILYPGPRRRSGGVRSGGLQTAFWRQPRGWCLIIADDLKKKRKKVVVVVVLGHPAVVSGSVRWDAGP